MEIFRVVLFQSFGVEIHAGAPLKADRHVAAAANFSVHRREFTVSCKFITVNEL